MLAEFRGVDRDVASIWVEECLFARYVNVYDPRRPLPPDFSCGIPVFVPACSPRLELAVDTHH